MNFIGSVLLCPIDVHVAAFTHLNSSDRSSIKATFCNVLFLHYGIHYEIHYEILHFVYRMKDHSLRRNFTDLACLSVLSFSKCHCCVYQWISNVEVISWSSYICEIGLILWWFTMSIMGYTENNGGIQDLYFLVMWLLVFFQFDH